MGKIWALLFGVTMLASLGIFLVAPFVGWWLPEGVSSHYWEIDFLFYVILWITGFFFILTEAILIAFMFGYGTQPDGKPPTLAPSMVAHLLKPVTGILNEPHKIELAWTIIPAAILLYIGFAQIGAWAEVKYQSRLEGFLKGKTPLVASVSARQFEWRIRYPSVARAKALLDGKGEDLDKFEKHKEFDDLQTVNALHVVKGHPVVIHLSTKDVIHSFNLPHFRIKQDALPGKTIKVWFTPTKSNTIEKDGKWVDGYNPVDKKFDNLHVWDLPCAELCGWGHYRMIGRIFVHETKEDFLKWMAAVEADETGGRKIAAAP